MYGYKVFTTYDAWDTWVSDEFMYDNWQVVLDKRSKDFIQFGADKTMRIKIYVYKDKKRGKEFLFELESEKQLEKHSKFLKSLEDSLSNRVEKNLMIEMYEKDMTDKWVKERKSEIDFHGNFNDMSEDQQDQIINPKHYKMIPKEAYHRFPEGLEYINLMEYILKEHNGIEGHLLGQVFKYACRLGKKDSKLQDAKKIEWYANRLVKVIENDGR